MTNSSNNAKKWKDALLRSSLPLEYLVAQKLDELGIFVSGEYSYLRLNETGVITEFSTDIWAFHLLEETKDKEDFWALVNFIIECKYSHPGVNWIFAPYPSERYIVTGYINTFQDLSIKRIQTDPLYGLDEKLQYCVKGIELHEKDANPSSISKGLHQLKYAAAQLSKDRIIEQICTWHDEELHIEFLCPILVTTASLYIFKNNLSLEDFRDSNELSDIACEQKALIVNQDNGVQLKEHIKQIADNLREKYPDINRRLKEFDKILTKQGYEEYHMPNDFFLNDIIGRSSERILVVNYNYFGQYIEDIIKLVSSAKSTLKQYAVLEHKHETNTTSVRPIQ
jgi:hypothetical protein